MPDPRELVLVGGGHAHVQVLRCFARAPWPGVRLSVVVDHSVAVYSGMVPGLVAGQYEASELEIDVRPLARRAGARVVAAAATGVDPVARRIAVAGGAPLAYDVASLDVGSIVRGLDRPGAAEHALPTRPIGALVRRVGAAVARARARGRCRVAVVGGGAGGIELALALRARLAREGVRDLRVALLESGPRVLGSSPEAVARRAAQALRARGVALHTSAEVARVEAEGLCLDDGSWVEADLVVWATGAAAPPWLAAAPLPHDAAGFVRVTPALEVEGCEGLFAAGDCAALDPPRPKAGVYAVREGPILAHNLRARIAGRPLRRYRPQRDFLTLLNLGDGAALGFKWGVAVEGRAVFALKDWIDRRFVRRFQVLDAGGAAAAETPGAASTPAPRRRG